MPFGVTDVIEPVDMTLESLQICLHQTLLESDDIRKNAMDGWPICSASSMPCHSIQ